MSTQSVAFRGFANPVDPTPAELRAWAYRPDPVAVNEMPADWDLLVANDRLIGTLFDLALDPGCPARRFALHCLYIYAADAIRTKFQAHPKRRLRKLVEQAEEEDDELLGLWAYNTRMLLAVPELFNYHDWCEGGLVRNPRKVKVPASAPVPPPSPPALTMPDFAPAALPPAPAPGYPPPILPAPLPGPAAAPPGIDPYQRGYPAPAALPPGPSADRW